MSFNFKDSFNDYSALLSHFMERVENSLGRLDSTIDLTKQLGKVNNQHALIKWVKDPVERCSDLGGDALAALSLSLLKKSPYFEQNFKNSIACKIFPTNIDDCLPCLAKNEEKLASVSLTLYELSKKDPTQLMAIGAWLLRDLGHYSKDAHDLLSLIPQLHQTTDAASDKIIKILVPYLETKRDISIAQLKIRRQEYEAAIKKEEEEEQKASQVPANSSMLSVATNVSTSLLSRGYNFLCSKTNSLVDTVKSAGTYVLKNGKHYFTVFRFNSEAASYEGLPDLGRFGVKYVAKKAHEGIDAGVVKAEKIAVSAAVDKVAKQAIKMVSKSLLQVLGYYLLAKVLKEKKEDIEHELGYQLPETLALGLPLAMFTSTLISYWYTLYVWKASRESAEDFAHRPASSVEEFRQVNQVFQRIMELQRPQLALEAYNHCDSQIKTDFLRSLKDQLKNSLEHKQEAIEHKENENELPAGLNIEEILSKITEDELEQKYNSPDESAEQ